MEQQLIKKYETKEKIFLFIEKIKPTIILSIFSFLVSRLTITNGISPFSQAFLLATGGKISTLLLSLIGIISTSTLNRHKYIFISLFSFTVYKFLKHAFADIPEEKASPFVLFFSSLIFGMIFVLFSDYVVFDVLLVILDAFLSAVFYYIVKNFIWIIEGSSSKRHFTAEEFTAPLIILCVIIAGIGNFYLPFDISPKNIICIYFIFITSMYATMGTTAQISVFMGIAAGLGMDYFALYLTYYSMNSLFCSVFSKYGKIASVLGFTIGNIILSILLAESRYMIITFQDITIASVFFALTPEKILGKFNYYFNEKMKTCDDASAIKNIATVKLERLSSAFKKLSDTITFDNDEKESAFGIETVYNTVSEKVCKTCALRFYCWDKERKKTIDSLNHLINVLIKNGTADTSDFPSFFSNKCTKTTYMLNNIINAYEIIRLNKVWENRAKENIKIYKEQFYELSSIISNLKNRIEYNPFFDKNLSSEISSALESEGILIKNLSVLKDCNDRYEIDISLFPCNNPKNRCYKSIASVLSEHLGIPFTKVQGKCSFKECHMYFCEAEVYDLEIAVKQSPKSTSNINGDYWVSNALDNGSRYIAICDGSGSGKHARYYSERTIKLLDKFLKTGFSNTSSVKIINSSFINSDIKECFSTVDLSIIDLKTGELEIVKKGASPTYIVKSDGDYDVISSNTLPLGVFGGEKGKIKKTNLSENDIIVMTSDGICDSFDKEDWIIDALSAIKSRVPEDIATTIMKIAAASGADDDKTVIVSKLVKRL